MLPYENVYSLENGALIKNTENKIEYIDENGKKRVKTNPTYKDFRKIGKYPLKDGNTSSTANAVPLLPLEKAILGYKVENGYIVPIYKAEKTEEEEL
ncbi:MAG: hypothetical protein E7602_06140 [Ruminococcaceae bacterium]|nr:hypothetical protein [Oscillospiraceae bacterium]